jgi:TRAP-type C4-dicarboxylate transport system substrate-binding protein
MKAMRTILPMFVGLILVTSVQAAPFKMRLTHQLPETHFLADEVKDFKKLVEEKTGGKVLVEIYPAAQAFKPNQVFNAVVTGSIEAGMTTNFEWSGTIPAMDLSVVPFLMTELPVIEKAIDGEVGAKLFKMMESKKVVPVMWLLQCRTNLYTSNEGPLLLPKDFKGKKMRGTSKIMNLGSEALGASCMSVSGPEVYTALQRGTLDIGLTGVDAALARHYYEIQKYGTVANTFSVFHVVFLNPDFWSSIPPDLQKTIKECALFVQKKSIGDSEKARDNAIKELQTKMTTHIQTKQEEDAWKAVMAKPPREYFLEKTGKDGKDLIDLVEKIKR